MERLIYNVDENGARWGRSSGKFMHDPIHGLIHVPNFAVEIIDTPQFQRLRDIRQLGACYYIFPGATHNRLEHCIGVSHLAGQMVEHFSSMQPELGITQREKDCVRIAGLCHDLGHGMFSHAFEEFLQKARPERHWHHEEASEMMLDDLMDDPENRLERDWSLEDRRFIKSLIRGVPSSSSEQFERGFLYEIVANKRNSIDVDKFDYLLRDCYNTGVRSSYDCSRLMLFSRVVNNRVCFHQKEVYNLFELFHTRYSLFKNVYTHRTGKSVELMLVDALLAADPVLHISSMVDDPLEYRNMTDALLREIERSKDPSLAKSRELINRLRRRDLYKFVDQINIPSSSEIKSFLKEHLTNEKLMECAVLSRVSSAGSSAAFTELRGETAPQAGTLLEGSTLSVADFSVSWCTINYAMKDSNPMDFVQVYSKYNPDQAFPVSRDSVSCLVPDIYEEILIRVYAKDASKMKTVQNVFRTSLSHLWKRYNGPENTISAIEVSNRVERPGLGTRSISPLRERTNSGSTELEQVTPDKKIRRLYNLGSSGHSVSQANFSYSTVGSHPSTAHNSPNHAVKLAPNEALTIPEGFIPHLRSPKKHASGQGHL